MTVFLVMAPCSCLSVEVCGKIVNLIAEIVGFFVCSGSGFCGRMGIKFVSPTILPFFG